MRSSLAILACVLALGATSAAEAKKRDPEKLPVTRVQDLHYGDVLFYFYQDEEFEALTRLNAYEQWKRLPNHSAEAQLLLGGLYLALGLHNEAGARFERLLTPDVPLGVRNRAWFYLGKVWYARGYYEKAEQAIRQVQGTLSPSLEAERQHLLANVLLRQGRFDDAIALLSGWKGAPDWVAYAQFNLGVALVRKGDVAAADPFLTAVGTIESERPELLSLKDRANLALGFAYLQAEQPDKAKSALERVRLTGPFSNKALLGVGWADASLGQFREALGPWLELRDRNLLDAAVQESFLAVPYAFSKLDANAQAAEYYETAIRSFDEESARLDGSIANIRDGRMLDELLEREAGTRHGWFWQLKNVPDAPESRYLYTVLAGHDFQEGLKNYRDLGYLGSTLGRWTESMEAFANMVDARERAYAERLPRADAIAASGSADRLQAARTEVEARLLEIERTGEVAKLGTAEERDQWARIERIEAALASAPESEDTAAAREKLKLVKGVLYWRLNEAFRARLWQQRRTLKDLDVSLREMQNRFVRVERARRSVPTNTGEFAARIAALSERLDALNQRLVQVQDKQNDYLEQVAIRELEGQKERLAAYQLQARFALATIYDRAANEGVANAPQSAPAPEVQQGEEPAAGAASPPGARP